MIVRTDLMQAMGLIIHFSTKTIHWEGYELPMKYHREVSDPERVEAIYHMVVQPPVLKEAELWQSSILDANYKKVDLGEASHWKHLTYNTKIPTSL